MPWTQGQYAPPNNFVQQYDLGQKKIRADLVDENFNDAAGAINTLNDSLTDVSAAATTTALGRARVATDAEVRAMETSGTSPAFLTPEQVPLMPMFNTRLVLTTSQSWVAPVDGWYRVRIVGGGGAGGSQTRANTAVGCGGLKGGDTSFNGVTAIGGGGGGGGRSLGGSGGGAAGQVVEMYMNLISGAAYTAIIGAGGAIQTTNGAAPTGTDAGVNGISSQGNYQGGSGAKGAGHGQNGYVIYPTSSPAQVGAGNGGNGGSNCTGYGGGGGGAAGGAASSTTGQPGLGGDNGSNAVPLNGTSLGNNGGNGGDGAVIIEYFDPSATA